MATEKKTHLRDRFWQRFALSDLHQAEWEALCDGCGLCCLVKAEDEDTVEVMATAMVCKLLDTQTCRCTDYANRKAQVPDCIQLTPETVTRYGWLPKSCAYRRLAEGRDLAWWHPLVSGDANTVHTAGVSVQGLVVSEADVHEDDLLNCLAPWFDVERGGD